MSKPLEIWLIRHGETAWSLTGQHSGRYDLPLTPHGEDEARATALALQGVVFDKVICSPLQRATRTCELTGYLPQARIEPDAAEWDYGDCTGFTQDQLAEKYPGWTIWRGPVPNGESIEQISARARRVIDGIKAEGGRVAVFAHGHFLRIFTTQYLGLEPERGRHFALATAAVCILGAEQGEPAIVAWNRKGRVG